MAQQALNVKTTDFRVQVFLPSGICFTAKCKGSSSFSKLRADAWNAKQFEFGCGKQVPRFRLPMAPYYFTDIDKIETLVRLWPIFEELGGYRRYCVLLESPQQYGDQSARTQMKAESNRPILWQGYLNKCSKVSGKGFWNRRFWVYQNSTLYCYKDEEAFLKGQRASKIVPMGSVTASVDHESCRACSKPFPFAIEIPDHLILQKKEKNLYVLSAESAAQRSSLMQKIHSHSNLIKYSIVLQSIPSIKPFANTMGIFRVAGDKQVIAKYEQEIGFGRMPDFKRMGSDQIHNMTGLLKRALRFSEPPLIPIQRYDDFIGIGKKMDDSEKIPLLCDKIAAFPIRNVFLLRKLCLFMNEVSQFSEESKMDPANLAIVIGPNILRKFIANPMKAMEEADFVKSTTKTMISSPGDVFPTFDDLFARDCQSESFPMGLPGVIASPKGGDMGFGFGGLFDISKEIGSPAGKPQMVPQPWNCQVCTSEMPWSELRCTLCNQGARPQKPVMGPPAMPKAPQQQQPPPHQPSPQNLSQHMYVGSSGLPKAVITESEENAPIVNRQLSRTFDGVSSGQTFTSKPQTKPTRSGSSGDKVFGMFKGSKKAVTPRMDPLTESAIKPAAPPRPLTPATASHQQKRASGMGGGIGLFNPAAVTLKKTTKSFRDPTEKKKAAPSNSGAFDFRANLRKSGSPATLQKDTKQAASSGGGGHLVDFRAGLKRSGSPEPPSTDKTSSQTPALSNASSAPPWASLQKKKSGEKQVLMAPKSPVQKMEEAAAEIPIDFGEIPSVLTDEGDLKEDSSKPVLINSASSPSNKVPPPAPTHVAIDFHNAKVISLCTSFQEEMANLQEEVDVLYSSTEELVSDVLTTSKTSHMENAEDIAKIFDEARKKVIGSTEKQMEALQGLNEYLRSILALNCTILDVASPAADPDDTDDDGAPDGKEDAGGGEANEATPPPATRVVIGQFDYPGGYRSNELTFRKEARLVVTNEVQGWLFGYKEGDERNTGWFPESYITSP